MRSQHPRRVSRRPLIDSIRGDLEEVRRRRAGLAPWRASAWFHVEYTAIVMRFGFAAAARTIGHGAWGLLRVVRPTGGPSLRQLVRAAGQTPWYSVTVVAVVALTTALAATVFAVVDGVLFKALPYPNADELRTVSGRRANGRGGAALTFDEVRAWQRNLPDVPLAAFQWDRDAGSLGNGRMIGGSAVDAAFFGVLGQGPRVGGFAPESFEVGAPPVAIISHRLWRDYFASSPAAIGRELPLVGAVDNVGRPIARPTVVGVLPPDFVFPTGALVDILRPAALAPIDRARRNESLAWALLRTPRDVDVDALTRRLDDILAVSQSPELPERSRLVGASVRQLDALGLTYRRGFSRLISVVGVLVLLACVALAALASGRAWQQARQARIRLTLGATPWDLLRTALAEASALTIAGGMVGVLAAPPLLAVVLRLLPVQAQFVKAPAIDGRAIGLVIALALVTAVVIALGSIRAASRLSLIEVGAAGNTRGMRGRGRALVVVQTALAFTITLGGVLGVMSVWRAWRTDPGYDPNGLVLVEVNFRPADFRALPALVRQINSSFAAIPGVSSGNFGGRMLQGGWTVATARPRVGAPEFELQLVQTGGALFDVLGLMPRQGRLPSTDELSGAADVVVLSERAAAALWPGELAIGKTVYLAQRNVTVIGIVSDPQFAGLTAAPPEAGQIYTTGSGRRDTTFVLRTTGFSQAALQAARQIVAGAGQDVELVRAVTMRDALSESIQNRRLSAWLHGGFAVSALAIAGTAILGLVAMTTSLRTREFGIRLALGARRDGLLTLLLREQLANVAVGLAVGMVATSLMIEIVRGTTIGVTPTDWRFWMVTALTIAGTAVAGVLIPAVRSTRIEPAVTLRPE